MANIISNRNKSKVRSQIVATEKEALRKRNEEERAKKAAEMAQVRAKTAAIQQRIQAKKRMNGTLATTVPSALNSMGAPRSRSGSVSDASSHNSRNSRTSPSGRTHDKGEGYPTNKSSSSSSSSIGSSGKTKTKSSGTSASIGIGSGSVSSGQQPDSGPDRRFASTIAIAELNRKSKGEDDHWEVESEGEEEAATATASRSVSIINSHKKKSDNDILVEHNKSKEGWKDREKQKDEEN
mmetsp:Transcript_28170/g.47385  ORF Transcript_28170/g.47385 Transcript_28170/m.47385 type:complete len:238 (+) Transcript_28170:1271-1984(+)